MIYEHEAYLVINLLCMANCITISILTTGHDINVATKRVKCIHYGYLVLNKVYIFGYIKI